MKTYAELNAEIAAFEARHDKLERWERQRLVMARLEREKTPEVVAATNRRIAELNKFLLDAIDQMREFDRRHA